MGETRPEFHAALHQAGHAVVAHVLEWPFEHASLDQQQHSLGALLHGRDHGAPVDDQGRGRLATVSVAGRIALEIHTRTAVGQDPDLQDRPVAAADVAREEAKAREILEACWPAVMAVADLLVSRERVTAQDVRSVVQSIVPAMARPVATAPGTGVAGVRRPSGAADSEDAAAAMPEGALVGGVEEGGGD